MKQLKKTPKIWQTACSRLGIAHAVSLANASRVCSDMIPHKCNVAVLRRFVNIGLAQDAKSSSSSSLQTNVNRGIECMQSSGYAFAETDAVNPRGAGCKEAAGAEGRSH
jgi:hypothetical protein